MYVKEKLVLFNDKGTSKVYIMPEILGGSIKYSSDESLRSEFHPQFGVMTHIWMPRTSEKMYFKTGVLFSHVTTSDGEIKNHYKVPIHFEYFYPKGFFRPRLSYGLNLYESLPVSLNIGANLRVTESMFLSVISDIEFRSEALLIPKELLSYSYNFGFLFKL